jgi:alpha-L-fucosidase
MTIDRRRFFAAAGGAALGACSSSAPEGQPAAQPEVTVPSFLTSYGDLYRQDPRAATKKWFDEARFGLFMHYGVYSQLKHGEWVQLRETIPVAEYGKLKDTFDPKNFDTDAICDMAIAAGMKYVNLTARHHDSFCLFRTNESDFTSLDSLAQRDLVGELADSCAKKGLGLCLYYSYALDWRHPYFYSREAGQKGEVKWDNGRPDYKEPQPEYKFEKDEDFTNYIKFVHAQMQEILHRYHPAVLWLDPIMGYYARPDLFPVEMTYEIIRAADPGVLICFKQGANGDEDFVAPEREPRAHTQGGSVGQMAWEKNKGKKIEICETLQPKVWGYDERNQGEHRNADDVMAMLEHCGKYSANLLLNTGPLPDGSIHPDDVATLLEVGKRL